MENSIQNLPTEIRNIIEQIVIGINLGETIVFCGAGISRDSGLPIVNQIVPYILDKFEIPEKDIELILDKDKNPKIPFELFIETLQENSRADEIFNIYDQGKPNTNHIFLAKLIKAGKVKTIVSTNFDKLIEKALGMEPKELIESKDFDVIFKEQDLQKISWSEERIRIIKLHGCVDDKKAMAITLKQIANKEFLKARDTIIEQVFSKGKHANVLILGYSSSDVFDISPQIEAIKEKRKKVFYVQHADNPKVEDIQEQKEKNPFNEFKGSERLYYDTNQLIKILWNSFIDKHDIYEQKICQTNWKENVDKWYNQSPTHTEVIKFGITASIFSKIGIFEFAKKIF